MANPILHKSNSTAAVVPSAGSLVVRELALNTADGRLFTKTAAGAVVEFARKDSIRVAMAGFNINGGGTITVNASNYLLWSARYIVISNGYGTDFAAGGSFDINCPTSGTITGAGGAANVTATAAGIPLSSWQALYYILPIGGATGSVAANFRVANYSSALTIPPEWILICVVNGDGSPIFNLPNGIALKVGESYNTLTNAYATNSTGAGVTITNAGTGVGLSVDDMSVASTITANVFSSNAASNLGYGLWANLPSVYGMLLSDAPNATYGGRIAGETTSDYNIYFTIGAGTNRGFVFRSSYGVNQFAINPDAVRTNVPLIVGNTAKFENMDFRWKADTTATYPAVIARNDNTNFYLLLTNATDGNGTFNGKRPLYIHTTTGLISFGNGANVTGGLTTVQLAAVSGTPTGTPSTTGGTVPAGTVYAKIIAVDHLGYQTTASTQSAGVVTTGATSSIVWNWTAVPGAASYYIFVGATGAQVNYFTSTTNTYTQTVNHTSGTAGAVPTINQSGGLNVGGHLNVGWYATAQYLNMSHAAGTNTTDTVFYSSTDAFIRKNTATGFKTSLALQNVTNESKATMFTTPAFTGLADFTGTGAILPASTAIAAASGATGGQLITSQGTAGTAGAAFITFHRPSAYAIHLGLDTDNKLKVGGFSMGAVSYELFHLGNIGTILTSSHVTTALGYTPASGGGLAPVVISTNTTATAGSVYVITASLTLTLPASPSAGNLVRWSDTSGLVTVVIARNGQNIMGLAQDLTLNTVYSSGQLMFADATRGWVLV